MQINLQITIYQSFIHLRKQVHETNINCPTKLPISRFTGKYEYKLQGITILKQFTGTIEGRL